MNPLFDDFLRGRGFIINKTIIAGDDIVRFSHHDKPRSASGWAMLFPEGNAGLWGDWRSGDGYRYWREDGRDYKALTGVEKRVVYERQQKARDAREADYEACAIANKAAWEAIEDTTTASSYLLKKQVGRYGIKVDAQGNAYFPLHDLQGKLWNYQSIFPSCKLFQHGKVSGCFHLIEGSREQIIIVSGYATGASIHEATGLCVVVCGGDGNILKVAKILREAQWKHLKIAADNDSDQSYSGNKVAEKSRKELGIVSVMPNDPGDFNDAAVRGESLYPYFFKTTAAFSYGSLLADQSPMPEDLIEPRILTEGGMLVFGGAPKVGKSDFVLSWLVHMAAGLPFMDMSPPRPLRVFYLQAEVQYHYLRERVKNVAICDDVIHLLEKNMVITSQVRMILNAEGVKVVGQTIRQHFGNEKPDIICIDPISNLYDQDSENDNAQMMTFLSQRVESLREYASEGTGFLLVHHTKKIAKDELAKDPFQMFSGASSLRRYYTTGMLMYRPDETVSECILTYEVRNGPRVPNINIDKDMGRWVIVDKANSRIGKHDEQESSEKERQRKIDIIKDEIAFEYERGNEHTVNSLSLLLDGKSGLGASTTIRRLLQALIAQNEIATYHKDGGNKVIVQS